MDPETLKGMSPAEQAKIRFNVDFSDPAGTLKKMTEMMRETGNRINPEVNELSNLYNQYLNSQEQQEAA